ncbi:MAG: dehydratase [Candidatus Marinimicrobia bacterium]|nr:dehydratase [Candidatus Neomarinimicrobiota bacterium]
MPRIFKTPKDLMGAEGTVLDPSGWMEMTQERVNLFADATDDHQWIHIDPEQAAEGPFGATIAHGFLTLALAAKFLPELIDVQNIAMGVNYGCDKVRFPSAVKIGSRIRSIGKIMKVEEIKGAYQVTYRITIEIEGQARPACVADKIARYYPER